MLLSLNLHSVNHKVNAMPKTQVHLHQTHQTIADFDAIFDYLSSEIGANCEGIHVFPELFLCGYPLQDLCLQKPFIESYQELLGKVNSWAKKLKGNGIILLGGLKYEFDDQGLPYKIFNGIFTLEAGSELNWAYTKKLLPNYDIFDEKKYFTPGKDEDFFLTHNGKTMALMVCEDMWPNSSHDYDPCQKIAEIALRDKLKIDLVINLSASPFNLSKTEKRLERASEISEQLQAPMVYVNRVGGEDEILFDGGSFIARGKDIIHQAPYFTATVLSEELPQPLTGEIQANQASLNTFMSLFDADLNQSKPPKLKEWNSEQTEMALQSLVFGLKEYARKNGF